MLDDPIVAKLAYTAFLLAVALLYFGAITLAMFFVLVLRAIWRGLMIQHRSNSTNLMRRGF